MRKIINLTQHIATLDQLEVGVFEPADKKKVQDLLTFEEIPHCSNRIAVRAAKLAAIAAATDATHAMIDGAPYLMGALEFFLLQEGITPLYSFSKKMPVEEILPDGSIKKSSVFKHAGWIEGVAHQQE